MSSVSFPVDSEGRTEYLGLQPGSNKIANRVLFLDRRDRDYDSSSLYSLINAQSDSEVWKEGIKAFTGTFNNVPVSIVTTGDCMYDLDSVVREIRHITEGPLVMIALSASRTHREDVANGTVVVAQKAFALQTIFQDFTPGQIAPRVNVNYAPSPPCEATPSLHGLLKEALVCGMDGGNYNRIQEGHEATCDSRYAATGYVDPQFADDNKTIIPALRETYPDVVTLGSKTYQLFHLAKQNCVASHDDKAFSAAACSIVSANSHTGKSLSSKEFDGIERDVAARCLQALVKHQAI